LKGGVLCPYEFHQTIYPRRKKKPSTPAQKKVFKRKEVPASRLDGKKKKTEGSWRLRATKRGGEKKEKKREVPWRAEWRRTGLLTFALVKTRERTGGGVESRLPVSKEGGKKRNRPFSIPDTFKMAVLSEC